MNYQIRPISAADAQEIVSWRYPEPFAIYNLTGKDVAAEIAYFLDLANRFHVVYDVSGQNGELVGFCSFGMDAQVPGGDYTAEALDIGLGMRPDLIGQGLGTKFLQAILHFANESFAPSALRATVAHFNQRSRRIFQKSGFRITQSFTSQSDLPIRFDVLVCPLT